MKCEKCSKPISHSRSAVINNVYYASVCDRCLAENAQVSSGDARWQRSVDAEDHEHDVLQPYGADGEPNADFIKAYPKQAKAVLTPEEIERAVRK